MRAVGDLDARNATSHVSRTFRSGLAVCDNAARVGAPRRNVLRCARHAQFAKPFFRDSQPATALFYVLVVTGEV